jgi:SMODS-associated and fused to various effectors sensor domain/TIR domain
MAPPLYFLSYSRANLPQTKVLCEALLAHGIDVWQDISNLGQGFTEVSIRSAISSGTDGMILIVTPESVASDFVTQVELAEADARIRRDTGYFLIPIFLMPIEEASSALGGCLTVPVSNFNGIKVESPTSERELMDAGHRVAAMIMARIALGETDAHHVGLSSKQKVIGNFSTHLNFLPHFGGGLPKTSVWKERIVPAVASYKSCLASKNTRVLRMRAHCHISLACLIGYTFRRPTAFRIEVEQNTGGTTAVWSSHEKPGRSPLSIVELPGELGSRDIVVVLNLVADDIDPVLRFTQANGLKYRAAMTLNSPRYPAVISAEEAAAIALELSESIKAAHARYKTERVHLFLAVPIGLSVLIGFNLNACGSVQCYEFENKNREYFPSCILE